MKGIIRTHLIEACNVTLKCFLLLGKFLEHIQYAYKIMFIISFFFRSKLQDIIIKRKPKMTSKFIKDLNLILHYDSSVQYTFVDCPLKWANYYYIKIYTCTL